MKTILFVCTGNTCRSPMAECLAREWLEQNSLSRTVQVCSAGICAFGAEPASLGAQRAMQRRKLSLGSHHSKPVSPALLQHCDWIVGLTQSHILQLAQLFPQYQDRMICLNNPPVSDPYGGNDADYERAAHDIERQLPALLTLLLEND